MPRGIPRQAQSREGTERKATARKMPLTGYTGRLYIDPKKVPSGMTYGWLRSHLMNEPDEGNMQTRMMDGWKPVPASRHPEWAGNHQEMSAIFGTASEAPTIIKYRGLVLCECPTRLVLEKRQRIAEQNFIQMNSLPGLENIEGAPTFNDSSAPMVERVRTSGVMDEGAIKQD